MNKLELVVHVTERIVAHIYIIIDGYKSNMFASETRFWVDEKIYQWAGKPTNETKKEKGGGGRSTTTS